MEIVVALQWRASGWPTVAAEPSGPIARKRVNDVRRIDIADNVVAGVGDIDATVAVDRYAQRR